MILLASLCQEDLLLNDIQKTGIGRFDTFNYYRYCWTNNMY